IRQVTGPTGAGFHRVAWDLRYPPLHPFVPEEERENQGNPAGVLVAPGTYRVSMARRVDGELTDLGQSQTFEVVSIREPTLEGTSQDERIAFSQQADELARAVAGTIATIDETAAELTAIKDVLGRSTADPALYARANALLKSLDEQRDLLAGDETLGNFAADRPKPVTSRIQAANMNPHWNAHGPTATHRQTLQVARNVYNQSSAELERIVDNDYAALKRELDAAGVPWSPGRGLP
ncbi:MAG: hypothetical protein R3315_14205, partial [Woeseiaceae bacterium]|nr:hypothetical protein [Woeseiaceae bacterium]